MDSVEVIPSMMIKAALLDSNEDFPLMMISPLLKQMMIMRDIVYPFHSPGMDHGVLLDQVLEIPHLIYLVETQAFTSLDFPMAISSVLCYHHNQK